MAHSQTLRSTACAAIALCSLFLSGAAAAQSPPGGPDGTVRPPESRPQPVYAGPAHHGPREPYFLSSEPEYRSPGLAVALSLTPLPVDFGNLYAGNLAWGVAYTAIEVSLMAPMMWFAGTHMDHGGNVGRSWSTGERGTMIGLVAGYVGVKLVAGLHAGYAARGFNARYGRGPMLGALPVPGGGMLALSGGL